MPTPSVFAEGSVQTKWFVSGAAIWLALAIASCLNWIRLDLIELLFLLAAWVIVPAALSQTSPLAKSYSAGIFRRNRWPLLATSALCTWSFLLPAGITAASLASAWLIICVCIAWGGMNRLLAFRAQSFPQFCFAIAECYIAVGGVWLVMSRAGLHPSGFQEPVVLLTAVHFHFAGFLSSIFAGLTCIHLQATRWAKSLRTVLLGTLFGPGILGIAFMLASPKLKLIAVALIVIGQCGLAVGMARISATIFRGTPISRLAGSNRLAASFLMLAAASSTTAMIFAAIWALGEYPLHPMTDLYHMERIHGVLNSVGFGAIGLLGWIKLRARIAETAK